MRRDLLEAQRRNRDLATIVQSLQRTEERAGQQARAAKEQQRLARRRAVTAGAAGTDAGLGAVLDPASWGFAPLTAGTIIRASTAMGGIWPTSVSSSPSR